MLKCILQGFFILLPHFDREIFFLGYQLMLTDINKLSTNRQQIVDTLSTNCRHIVNKLSTHCQQIVNKLSAFFQFLKLLLTNVNNVYIIHDN